MTTPDLVTAAHREVSKLTDLLPLLTDADGRVMLWQWDAKRTVRGTGRASMVLARRGGWAGPNRHNTIEFPKLQVEIYADDERDGGLPVATTSESFAIDIWRYVDHIFHRPDSGGFYWGNADGSVRIVSSLRGTEPDIMDVPDGDGVVRLLATYNIEFG